MPPRLLALPSAPPWGTGKENGSALSGVGWNQFLGPESVLGAIFGSMVALTSDFCQRFPLLPPPSASCVKTSFLVNKEI